MLVVLAVIAMLLGMSIPFVSGFGKGMRLKTSARGIVGTLRLAKSNAITYRKEFAVVFDQEKGEYWIEDGEGAVFEKKHRLPGSISFAPGQGNEGGDPITFDGDRLVLFQTGAIRGGGGSVTITDRRGDSRTVSVLGSTGKIRVE